MSANPKFVQSSDHDFRLLIDGKFVAGASTLEVINPATGKVLTRCARADKAQLDAAVLAAKNAFPAWAATGIEARRQALTKIAAALEARSAEFARLLTEEQGKPPGARRLRDRRCGGDDSRLHGDGAQFGSIARDRCRSHRP